MADYTMYYGRGAGREPTASAVIGDTVDVARNILAGCPRRVPSASLPPSELKVKDISTLECERYLRVTAALDSNSEQTVKEILGKHGISPRSCQKKAGDGVESLIIVTDKANEAAAQTALSELDSQEFVRQPTIHLRIGE